MTSQENINTRFLYHYIPVLGQVACPMWVSCFHTWGKHVAPSGQNPYQFSTQNVRWFFSGFLVLLKKESVFWDNYVITARWCESGTNRHRCPIA